MNVEAIAESALALPSEARALLADRLVESLDPSEDGHVHRLWVAEVRRRSEAFHAGKAQTFDGPEVLERIRRSLAR